MTKKIEVGSLVQHKTHGFEGVVSLIKGNSKFATVEITKGVHPYNQNTKTYQADLDNLKLTEKKLEVGSYVQHTRYGFKGTVESLDAFNSRVRITEGVHPFESYKKTYDASPELLKVIDSPKEHFEKLLKEYKVKVEKANAEAKEKADELAKVKAEELDDSKNVMEIEMNGMKIKTDYRTFKKLIKDFSN